MLGTATHEMPILLVEDDEIDTEIIRRMLARKRIQNPLFCASDGVEALEMLSGDSQKSKIPRPCLVLLDLNMPKMNGLELLEEMHKDPVLRQNVTFVLTTSSRREDKTSAYQLCVAGYFLKDNMDELSEMISHYCRINEFPD